MKTSNKILTTTFLTLLIIVISTMAYVRANSVVGESVTAEGEISKRHYDIKDLHTLNIRNGRVTLYQGEPYVEVLCADNIHEHINVHVKDGVLDFRLHNGAYEDIGFIDLKISTKDIRNISLFHNANLTAEEIFKTDVINISAHNGASINLPMEANVINVNSNDGGEINLSGQSTIVNASARNSGNINASNLEAIVVNATVSDASKLITTVKEKLVIEVFNAGEVLYKGNPEVIINTQADAGRVTKL